MKAGREHRVPLAQAPMDLLDAMAPSTELIFPGRRGVMLSDMAMTEVLRRMDRNDITVHGFRSTFRDWCSSSGKVRVLMTNLLDPVAFPAHQFGHLYHQRWRIEEAFKRLKHRLNLEHLSGLSQQSALHDYAAKIVCDNLQSLATETALREASLPATRRINRAAAQSILKPLLPALLLGADIATRLLDALKLIAGRTYSHRPGIITSKPRVARQKSHKSMSHKSC